MINSFKRYQHTNEAINKWLKKYLKIYWHGVNFDWVSLTQNQSYHRGHEEERLVSKRAN